MEGTTGAMQVVKKSVESWTGEKVSCHYYTVQPMQIDLEIVYSLW